MKLASEREIRNLNQLKLSAYFFMRSMDRFSLIRTDRLHVAIGAALLGKDVELYVTTRQEPRVYDFSLSRSRMFGSWIGSDCGRL